MNRSTDDTRLPDANRDPITGAPGSHPVGTGVGALAGGAAAGAATGTVAGPIGTLVGAAVGAVVGGLAGKAVAEQIDPTAEEAYWRDNYTSRPYVPPGSSFDDYGPAFGMGVLAFNSTPGRSFDEMEPDLSRDWGERRGSSRLEWSEARLASRDAWERANDLATPGGPTGAAR